MSNIFKIALRNLFRYRRRTLLTMALIVSGMVFVLVFVAVTGSFKDMMVDVVDAGSCCDKAHKGSKECGHGCCKAAFAKAEVCLKCNPKAKGKT